VLRRAVYLHIQEDPSSLLTVYGAADEARDTQLLREGSEQIVRQNRRALNISSVK